MLEKRKEVECGFEAPDVGGAGIRDQGKWVLLRELTNQGHPFGEGVKYIAEGFLELFLCMGEIEVFGEEGKVLVTSMATSFVVVSPLVRPDLIAKSLYAFPFAVGEGLEFFA